MAISSLMVAVILFVSPALFAQHSSGGGSSSGGGGSSPAGSSVGSSGGSHGGYSGGSSSGSSSLGSHSSGSSASSNSRSSGGSASRSSSARSASRGSGAGSAAQRQIEKNARAQGNNVAEQSKNAQPVHRGFIGFLRHPFRKRTSKPAEADLRRPICKDKPCRCPAGEAIGNNGACVVSTNNYNQCPTGSYWDGVGCVGSSLFRSNDCGNLALAVDRQARQAQFAESSRQSSCSSGAGAQECSDLTARSQDEAARYRSLQQQYQQCRRQPLVGLLDASAVN